MYTRGLIPRNFAELAEAVPIGCRGLDFDVSGHTHLLSSYPSILARILGAQMNRHIETVLSIHNTCFEKEIYIIN